ncbi:MAG: hypothetical protein V5A46_01505 [Haloferacaceae archaeon]
MTDGTCHLCGETYTKRGMTRHLRSCLAGHNAESGDGSALHLRIVGARRPDYWIHVAIDHRTHLETLDGFLRELWLECCNHLSAFTFDDIWYEKQVSEGPPSGPGPDSRSMAVPIGDVVEVGDEFGHEYDFGSTTELALRVAEVGGWDLDAIAERGIDAVETGHDGIALLARNEPPKIACGSCGAPATTVCQTCLRTRGPDAWFCEECATAHESDCDHPAYLPRVNSPRTGVCGYTG